MSGTLKHYALLHLTVFVWGFTAILRDLISLGADKITFFRTGIAFLSLVLVGLFIRLPRLNARQLSFLLVTGLIVGLHWYFFFLSIKISNEAVAAVCMSASTLFTAIIEPIIYKRRYAISEFILAIVITAGIILIIGFEPTYVTGILVGLLSALLSSTFNVLNGKHIRTMPSLKITQYEMLGGCITILALLLATGSVGSSLFQLTTSDWVFLLILGLVCTTGAFMMSVWLTRYLTPFTISMSVNLEPVYTILIALVISTWKGETHEKMSLGFYLGALVIIGAIFVNALLKRRKTLR